MHQISFGHFLVITGLIGSMSTVFRSKIRMKCTFFYLYCKSHCFWKNLHHWQKFYTAAGSEGIDKFHLCLYGRQQKLWQCRLGEVPCKRAGLDRLQWCKLQALLSRPESITEILSYISFHPSQDGDYNKVEVKCSLKYKKKLFVHKSPFISFFTCFLLCRHSFQSII